MWDYIIRKYIKPTVFLTTFPRFVVLSAPQNKHFFNGLELGMNAKLGLWFLLSLLPVKWNRLKRVFGRRSIWWICISEKRFHCVQSFIQFERSRVRKFPLKVMQRKIKELETVTTNQIRSAICFISNLSSEVTNAVETKFWIWKFISRNRFRLPVRKFIKSTFPLSIVSQSGTQAPGNLVTSFFKRCCLTFNPCSYMTSSRV